jgi:hypothetical protein
MLDVSRYHDMAIVEIMIPSVVKQHSFGTRSLGGWWDPWNTDRAATGRRQVRHLCQLLEMPEHVDMT